MFQSFKPSQSALCLPPTSERSSWADQIDCVEIGVDGNLVVTRLYHSITGLNYIPQQPNGTPILAISE